MWPSTRLTRLLGIKYPIIGAPMTGGPSTPALAIAVSRAGGLGSLGLGFMNAEDVRKDIREVKAGLGGGVGVYSANLFVPSPFHVDGAKVEGVRAAIRRAGYQAPKDEDIDPIKIAVPFDEQAQMVLEEGVPVVSFTFGLPPDEWLTRFRKAGRCLIGTATTVEEARRVRDAGMQVVVAQGYEAGGHRGTFARPAEESLVGTFALVPQVVDEVVPEVAVVAAGGVMDGRGITAALALGAHGVQMGTAFLTTSECGASQLYKDVLLCLGRDRPTALTKAYSGKMARGVRNAFMMEDEGGPSSSSSAAAAAAAPASSSPSSSAAAAAASSWQQQQQQQHFPVVNYMTRGMRAEACRRGDWERMALWAGQGFTMKNSSTRRGRGAEEVLEALVRETENRMAELFHGDGGDGDDGGASSSSPPSPWSV